MNDVESLRMVIPTGSDHARTGLGMEFEISLEAWERFLSCLFLFFLVCTTSGPLTIRHPSEHLIRPAPKGHKVINNNIFEPSKGRRISASQNVASSQKKEVLASVMKTLPGTRSPTEDSVVPPRGGGPLLTSYERQGTRAEGEAEALREQLRELLERDRTLRGELTRYEYELKCCREDQAPCNGVEAGGGGLYQVPTLLARNVRPLSPLGLRRRKRLRAGQGSAMPALR